MSETGRAIPEYWLSADIHYHKAGAKYPDQFTLYLIGPRCFYQPLLVMRSGGESLATTFKEVTE